MELLKRKATECSKLGEVRAGKKTVERDVDGGGLACEVPRYINTGGTVRCYCKLRFFIRSAGDEESAVITRDQQHLSETFCFTGTMDAGTPVRRN